MHKIFTKNHFTGKKVIYLPKCHSTNTIAADLLASGQAEEGTMVMAGEQTQGRGQRGSTWVSEPGQNLLFSIVLFPGFLKPAEQFWLLMLAAVAVMNSLREMGIGGVSIKWPNDVYVTGRKIAGILIESTLKGDSVESSVMGVGVNVNQEKFPFQTATSVCLETGHRADVPEVAALLTLHIEAGYLQLKGGQKEQIEKNYKEGLLGLNELRAFRDAEGAFIGKITGVSAWGKLRVEKEGAEKEYDFKEIEFIFGAEQLTL